MRLSELAIGQDAVITSVETRDVSLRKHILEMGLTPGVEVSLLKTAPLGDPIELLVRGYNLTIRKSEAENINIAGIHDSHEDPNSEIEKKRINFTVHPNLGEDARLQKGARRKAGTPLSLALVGNQNCGKTTLFNQLTGSNQHVGNFPGVTVDRKDGKIKGHKEVSVTDLPGIYSLAPYSSEEIVTRDFIIKEKIDGIINIVDATNIERNLYLTTQLMELDKPMVIALNMMDEVRENGGTIDINALEQSLGVPVVPISASKGEGLGELVEHIINVALNSTLPRRTDFCLPDGKDKGAVHRAIHSIVHSIQDHCEAAGYPLRFAATQICQDDHLVVAELALDDNEKDMIEHILTQMEEESGLDRMAAIVDMKFSFIETLTKYSVVRPKTSKEQLRSIKVDRILTGKYTAIPCFVLVMAITFYLTFGPLGSFLSDLMALGIEKLGSLVEMGLVAFGTNPVVISLVVDGIFSGVGTVLSFMPFIVILFFFLSMLEDSGYMARVAFVMDRLLRKLGLSGRSFVPMLVGFGCSVPAIMSARTLPSERDRKLTVLLVPFMSCSAKVPIYAFFSAFFFPDHAALVMVALYFTGIVVGILFALLLNRFFFRGEAVPFVMELPTYRIPSPVSVARLMWDKAKDFILRAFTIIFVASIIVWFLETFDIRFNVVTDSQDSLLASLGSLVSVLFIPLGLGDWRLSTALFTGFIAKENVVSTLTILIPSGDLSQVFTPLAAVTFLVFCLLYTPCVAAIGAVKREMGGKSAVLVAFMQCLIAYAVALLVHTVGLLF